MEVNNTKIALFITIIVVIFIVIKSNRESDDFNKEFETTSFNFGSDKKEYSKNYKYILKDIETDDVSITEVNPPLIGISGIVYYSSDFSIKITGKSDITGIVQYLKDILKADVVNKCEHNTSYKFNLRIKREKGKDLYKSLNRHGFILERVRL